MILKRKHGTKPVVSLEIVGEKHFFNHKQEPYVKETLMEMTLEKRRAKEPKEAEVSSGDV